MSVIVTNKKGERVDLMDRHTPVADVLFYLEEREKKDKDYRTRFIFDLLGRHGDWEKHKRGRS